MKAGVMAEEVEPFAAVLKVVSSFPLEFLLQFSRKPTQKCLTFRVKGYLVTKNLKDLKNNYSHQQSTNLQEKFTGFEPTTLA